MSGSLSKIITFFELSNEKLTYKTRKRMTDTNTILWAHTWWGDETKDALIKRIQGAYECRLVPSPRDAREVLLLTGSKVKGTGGPFCERDPKVKVIAINLDTLILSEVTTTTGVSDKNKWWLGWGGLAVPFDCGEGKTAILCAGGSGGPKTFPETLTSGAGSSLRAGCTAV